jgi:metal-dependent amidase/aminoacylase/carboxypeptidase family protein
LLDCGLLVLRNFARNGVVGILSGSDRGKTIAFRSDMDALNAELLEGIGARAVVPGIVHACGHDVHTAIGLGIARVMSLLRKDIKGQILFIFQPEEETTTGAQKMIDAGVLNLPNPDVCPEAIIALHVSPFPVGTIVTFPGMVLPGLVEFSIHISGPGALGSARDLESLIDSTSTIRYPTDLRAWSDFYEDYVASIQENSSYLLSMAFVNENSSELEARLVGFIKASEMVEIEQLKEKIYKSVRELMNSGMVIEIEFDHRLPVLVNDQQLATWAIKPLSEIAGVNNVLVANRTIPYFGEDFSLYLEKIPGAMFFLGASNKEKGIFSYPHLPGFSIDEQAIKIGVQSMTYLLWRFLER